ncbi:hypothetical protein HYPSUDRAFT_143489 [Hypholoma sublateritium FD-334 SS-4]|uniref:HTH CENPB-type domain-containing protein n=1 Tax=Hypholoma sublateritium (strain FD-334 SS-4) TaxID=945553 RepID=A0A0D2KYK1_HYPSF|nr:hypothetical protein HYPSUDRAFT_143489 [Hypholoma sublateritium FD-334 SS-4]
MKYFGFTGHALNKQTIAPKVESILPENRRRKPSKSWIRRFLQRHHKLVLARGSGLDPKRARAFNKPVISHYFTLLGDIIKQHDIPWENVYNMDEKGIQLGGGRKGDATKYFFSREDQAKYQLKSDKLQLITIVEVVCADGSSDIMPCFIFPGATMAPEWFCEDGAL